MNVTMITKKTMRMDDEDGDCPYCDYEGLSSHYHCGNCGEETGMFGHWETEGFTCEEPDFWEELEEWESAD